MEAPPEIEKAFQTTFKLIFGECNLKLDDLADYLYRWHYPVIQRKSAVSGKDVLVSSDFYREDAKFISNEEIDFGKKSTPLGIDDIKDIDSIVAAIQERDLVYYSGNKFFGNSSNISEADNCTDAVHIYKSHNITGAKYVAYSSYVRFESEYIFGSGWFLRSRYLIKSLGADNLTRAFETYLTGTCSDMFFCYYCMGCSNLMFSFNQRSKKYCIGNNQLSKDEYLALRDKLVTESREYLEKHKTFPSIFDLGRMDETKRKELLAKSPKKIKREEDTAPIEKAFKSTATVILGADIGTLEENKGFLTERAVIPCEIITFFGNPACYGPIFFFNQIPKDKMINMDEELACSELHIDINENDGLKSILSRLGDIALYRIDLSEGTANNAINNPIMYNAINSYFVVDLTFGKNCAFCTYALNDESVFGCYRAIHSKFTIRCENSYNLTACFEMDGCSNCSNSMFCHNSENLDHCMFCFNTKSKRYAIGNVEIGREEYMKIKERVLSELVRQIKEGRKLKWDIYNLGAGMKT